MKAEFRREMHRSYMILSGEELPEAGSYPMRMLEENVIPGFLPCSVREIDGERFLYYDITSMLSLRVLLDMGQVDRELLTLLFSGFANALDAMTEFLFWDDCALADPDMIFVNSSRTELRLVLYPGEGTSFHDQIRELAESLLPRLRHEDTAAVKMGYSFYQLCMESDPDSKAFRALLSGAGEEEKTATECLMPEQMTEDEERERLMDAFFTDPEVEEETIFQKIRHWFFRDKREKTAGEEKTKTERKDGKSVYRIGTVQAVAEEAVPYGLLRQRSGPYLPDAASNGAPDAVSETGMSGAASAGTYAAADSQEADFDDNATRVLAPEDMAAFVIKEKARLMPADAGKAPLILTGGNAIVGKSAREADYVIDSPVVSRLHARLMWDGSLYRIMDLNSRNGTFINGERMKINEVRPLADGDEVRFADAAYEYHIR